MPIPSLLADPSSPRAMTIFCVEDEGFIRSLFFKKKCKKGGRVLASGGYGCVFTPALKCHGSTKRKKDFISKLMTERHALQEYDEITQLKNKLETIDDYKDYFLINDISVCKPSKLTSDDLDNFSEECSALPKDGITHKNINSLKR